MEDEYEKFVIETIQGYQDEIKQYSLDINNGDKSAEKYMLLFSSYNSLYEFTQKDKKHQCITKDTVDRICETLLSKIKQEMTQGLNLATNYCFLGYIATYKKENTKALEYYDKAVEIDEKTLLNRAQFKNHYLNDRQGALDDYNRALANESNPNERKIIQHLIKNIDLIRESDALVKSIHWQVIMVAIVIVLCTIYTIYKIFFK